MTDTSAAHASPLEGWLGARPRVGEKLGGEGRAGLHPLNISEGRDGLLYVPVGYRAEQPCPLVVMLHGAGGSAQGGISHLQPLADAANLILLASASRRQTWDVIVNDYGPDVEYIDLALAQTFRSYAVDPEHVAVGGFSDGASYALSLGITNGGLFTHIIAFSPGFMVPTRQEGEPRIYISHGTHDAVLPIDRCSRRLAPQLKRAGYDVLYHEFDGPHTVPADIAREAVEWFTGVHIEQQG
jgi:phospholipase/carboxylesterase